ncbi:hypothetical protein [Sphingomonas oryzagri]
MEFIQPIDRCRSDRNDQAVIRLQIEEMLAHRADRRLVEHALLDAFAHEIPDKAGLLRFGVAEIDQVLGLPMLIVGAMELAEAVMGIHRVITDEAEMRLSKHATRAGGSRRSHYLRTADTT